MNENQNLEKQIYCRTPSVKILQKIKELSLMQLQRHTTVIKETINKEQNLFEIHPRVFIFYKNKDIVKNATHRDSYCNIDYLLSKINYKYKALYYTTDNNTRVQKNVILLKTLDFDCELFADVASSVKTWLNINNMNIVIFDKSTHSNAPLVALLECICIFLTKKITSTYLFDKFKSIKTGLRDMNTIDRYKNYFFDLISKKTETLETLLLHQVIISNYPKINNFEQFQVIFYVIKGDKTLKYINDVNDADIMYKDNFYIIFTNINIEVTGDVVLRIDLINKDENIIYIEFPMNAYCYEQGLNRYKRDDLISSVKDKFSNDFNFDVVFLDANRPVKSSYKLKDNIVHGIKVINRLIKLERASKINEECIDDNDENAIRRFSRVMNLSKEEINVIYSFLSLENDKKNIRVSKHKFIPENKSLKANKNSIFESLVKEAYPKHVIDKESFYSNLKSKEFKLIEPIKESFFDNDALRIVKKKVMFKKKEFLQCNAQKQNFESIKPLHWIPILNKKETIFTSNVHYSQRFDYEKFKKFFCIESNTKQVNENLECKNAVIMIEPKRLFLVSLALKHLSKKNITSDKVYNVLKNNSNEICIQDLLNLENVFPSYEELHILENCDYDKLTVEEKTMLEFSKLTEVKKIVKILLFEKKFFDEIFLIEELLEKIKYTFCKIIESQDLKIVFKTLLDLGNMINYEYSVRKKIACGFKLSSIYTFFDYKGHSDYSLFKFFMESIDRKNIVVNIKHDLKYLDIVRKEQFNKIREKINDFIDQFKVNLETYASLTIDKPFFTNFLLFTSEKLENIKKIYEECVKKEKMIKKHFDENEKKNIADILDCISFLANKMTSCKE